MSLNKYMQENFPNLELRPPLFYNWNIGIRFGLDTDNNFNNDLESRSYLEEVYKKAITLFKSIHSPEDNIYIVVDVNNFADGNTFKRKLNIFSKYVKEKSVLAKLQETTIPYVFPEDDEDGIYKTHRFTLKCQTSDIKYIPMLKAICNQDLGVKPIISHSVYFINTNKNTIFHIYDDKGCDLLAISPEVIRPIYDNYNEWILNYDRDEIDNIFK